MKASEVYLRAAKLVDSNLVWAGCCRAIATIEKNGGKCGAYETPIQQKFARVFKPDICGSYWWASFERNERVLALLLMSEIAKDAETSVRRKPRKKLK